MPATDRPPLPVVRPTRRWHRTATRPSSLPRSLAPSLRYSTCIESDATLASYCHPPDRPTHLRSSTCSETEATLASYCLPPSLPPLLHLYCVERTRRWHRTAT